MSASVLQSPEFIRVAADPAAMPESARVVTCGGWNPQDFAREQIRGLVRQVFFSRADRAVRRVVFGAVEAQNGVGILCRRVGETLASETQASVAVVTREALALDPSCQDRTDKCKEPSTFRATGTRVRGNLWFLPEDEIVTPERPGPRRSSLSLHLAELQHDFEYLIIEGPPVAASSDAANVAQAADGMVLVLSADHTRRATARKVKEMLEASAIRVLGSVLSDRTFPIPERIYRRL